jgi:hypothetical protein
MVTSPFGSKRVVGSNPGLGEGWQLKNARHFWRAKNAPLIADLGRPRVARFFLVQLTKTRKNIRTCHKIYQVATKYTKLPQNIPNGRKIDQMDIKYTDIFQLQYPPKFTQRGIFGFKMCHLTTLVPATGQRNCLVFLHQTFKRNSFYLSVSSR